MDDKEIIIEGPEPLRGRDAARARSDRVAEGVRYGVMGAGLVGTYLGGMLAATGANTVLVGRGRVQGDIARHGLTLTRLDGEDVTPDGFLYATDASALAGCDVVLVAVKSQDTAEAARQMEPHVPEGTLVVSFQNAMGNRRALREGLPFREVLAGVVPFNVTSPEPGTFHQGTEGALLLQASTDARALAMQAAFAEVGMELEMREAIEDVMWGKLLLNLNNPLNALSGGSLRDGLAQGPYRRVLARMVSEALDALDAAGIVPEATGRVDPQRLPRLLRLPGFLYIPLMDRLLKIDPHARSSMLEDLEAGRGSENDMLQGEVIRLGRRHGVSIDTNRRVAEAMADAFAAGESPRMSGREMAERFLG